MPERILSTTFTSGDRLSLFLAQTFPAMSESAQSRALGFPNTTIREWKKGRRIPEKALKRLEELGCDMAWLLAGAEAPTGGKPAPNAIRPREPIAFTLEAKNVPVVGSAAADESQGSRAGFFPPDPNAQFDEIVLPETTSAVKIIGDSMSPVLLDGQYAFVGPEYMGLHDRPKNYEIVVADVAINDQEQSGSDRRWEGVYCKRIVDAGDVWVFLSINQTGTPFSIAKANCRIWPVIGVWFAGKGKIPEGD